MLENARHLRVLLVHGEDDAVSPLRQSTMLDEAMRRAGFAVEFLREPRMGHEGALVAKYLRKLVGLAAEARAVEHPSRVSYRSFRADDLGAYGVRFARARPEGEAFVDLEKRADGIYVLAAKGITKIILSPGALG